jgi:hypothetical protein
MRIVTNLVIPENVQTVKSGAVHQIVKDGTAGTALYGSEEMLLTVEIGCTNAPSK